MAKHIVARRDGGYVVDTWKGTEMDDWARRALVPSSDLPDEFGVGDVVTTEYPFRNWRQIHDEPPSVEPAPPDTAAAVRDNHDAFRRRLRDHAATYDVDLDATDGDLSDGDVLFVASPPGLSFDFVRRNETAYVTPEGFYSPGEELARDVVYAVNATESTLESGMAFEVVDVDDLVFGLRYDEAESREMQTKPGLVTFSGLSHQDFGDEGDVEPPLYAMFDGFDDGLYYSSLYDSAPNTSDYGILEYREIATGFAHEPYRVDESWARADLVPVDEVYLDESDHPEAPVAVVSRGADAFEAERK